MGIMVYSLLWVMQDLSINRIVARNRLERGDQLLKSFGSLLRFLKVVKPFIPSSKNPETQILKPKPLKLLNLELLDRKR